MVIGLLKITIFTDRLRYHITIPVRIRAVLEDTSNYNYFKYYFNFCIKIFKK